MLILPISGVCLLLTSLKCIENPSVKLIAITKHLNEVSIYLLIRLECERMPYYYDRCSYRNITRISNKNKQKSLKQMPTYIFQRGQCPSLCPVYWYKFYSSLEQLYLKVIISNNAKPLSLNPNSKQSIHLANQTCPFCTLIFFLKIKPI